MYTPLYYDYFEALQFALHDDDDDDWLQLQCRV